MKTTSIPYYCGGRLLYGLYDLPRNNSYYDLSPEGYMKLFFNSNNHKVANLSHYIDNFQYVPNDVDTFKQALFEILLDKPSYIYNNLARPWSIGVIYAITSRENGVNAAKFLPEAGFKNAGVFRKSPGANPCTTWIGDVHNSVWPAISPNRASLDPQVKTVNNPPRRPWATVATASSF